MSFEKELNELEARFAQMEPELCHTVRDDEFGIEGYVVVWNTAIAASGPLGPVGKGGTRITPDLTLDDVRMLARTMALKNAAAGLPLGGSKSGLKADPDAPDFEKRYRRFVSLCKPLLAENGGIFGGFGFDIGARPVHALWACDELKSTRSFTGKPVSMGGTDYDREGIAGLGVSVAALATVSRFGLNPPSLTFAVQGVGAMGAAVIRYFGASGAQLKAISDPRLGGTWEFSVEPSDALMTALSTGDLSASQNFLPLEARRISDDSQEVLYTECDLLFPCAVQKVITAENVYRINALYVIEGANGPVTPEARTILHQRNIRLVPDFIANPGGVIAAFVELSSSSENKVEEAKMMTRNKIAETVRKMWDLVEEHQTEPQKAGMYLALKAILR